MPVKILLVSVKFNVSQAEYEQMVATLVNTVLDAPGLRWKIWLMNAAQGEAGGVYLFDDEPSVEAVLTGPLIAGLKSQPALANLSAKAYDVMEAETARTYGPVGEGGGGLGG